VQVNGGSCKKRWGDANMADGELSGEVDRLGGLVRAPSSKQQCMDGGIRAEPSQTGTILKVWGDNCEGGGGDKG